jgi:serine/threonine protein kinase
MTRYRRTHVLGSGSYGTIYQGIDLVNQQNVAIKEQSTKHGSQEQIEWEYTIYRKLGKQPIVGTKSFWPNAYDMITVNQKKCLVMDLLGPSVDQVFKNSSTGLDPLFTGYIAMQCISLLQTMHSLGVIHRDLKPQNLVLEPQPGKFPQLYLIDFGLARVFVNEESRRHDSYQTKRGLRGTLRYMSTWSHLGVKQSRRDDVQSLGYMLVYLCTGKLPWQKLPKLESKNDDSQHILRYKMNTSCEMLVSDIKSNELKNALCQYMLIAGSLSYTEKPPYDFLRSLFQPIALRWQGLNVNSS